MSTAVAAPPGRTRRWRYVVWIAASVLLLFFVGLGFYLNSDAFRQAVRNKVVTQLERMTGGRVELQSLDWKWTTLQCDARGLTIHGLESPAETPYAHADHISVGIRIKSLFSRQIALSNVVVDHLVIHIIVYPDGSTNQPAPKRQSTAGGVSPEHLFDLGINHLEVSDGTLLLNQEQIPFAVTGDRLSAGISYSPAENGYQAKLSISLASARWRNLPAQRGEVDMQVLLRSTDAEIRSLRITMPGSTLQAAGSLRNYSHPEVQAHYTASIDLADAARLARVPELRGGRANLNGNLDYRGDRYSTSGTLHVEKLEWKDPAVHATDVEASSAYYLDPDRVSVTSLSGKIFGGKVAGEVKVNNWNPSVAAKARPERGASEFQFGGLELNRVAVAATEPDIPLRRLDLVGRISGTLKSSWTGPAGNAVTAINLTVTPPETPAPQQVPLNGQLRASYRGDVRVLDVAALNLATRAIRINATGRLGSDKAEARISANSTGLDEIRPMLTAISPGTRIPLVLKGRGSFNGSISGKFNALSTRGRLELDDFDTETAPLQVLEATAAPQMRAQQVQRIHWDSLVADVVYSPSSVSLQNATLRRGQAKATFSASAALRNGRLDEHSSAINLALHVQDAPVEELQPLLGLKYPVTGVLVTDLHITGTPADPRGTGSVHVTRLTVRGEPFRSFRSQVRIAANTLQLSDILLAHNGATVSGNFSHNFAAGYSEFDLTGKNIDLAAPRLFEIPRLTVAGKAAFHVTGSGREDAPVLNGELNLDNLVLNSEAVGSMTITAQTHDADMVLQGRSRFERSSLAMDGDIKLRGDWPGQMKINFANLDFDPIIRAYFQGQITGHSSIAGTVEIHGPFRRPRDLVITGVANQLSAELEHIRLHNDGPVHFSMDSEFARMDQFRLVGDNTDAYVQGGIRLAGDHPLDLHTKGRVDLRLLQGYNPNIIAYGPANFS
ncbi:MAG: hypothetical protein ACM3SW_13250, partial [Actinomycetota bacterium]